MMQEEEFKELLSRYIEGKASEQEIAFLESNYQNWDDLDRSLYTPQLLDKMDQLMWSQLSQKLNLKVEKPVPVVQLEPARSKRFYIRVAVAAAVATIIFGAGLFYYTNQKSNQTQNSAFVNDIAPGKQGATLTLANGKKIKLSNVMNGEIAKEAGVIITKTADGKLVYQIKETGAESTAINTLSTARGEMYDVTLPDGSLVTLNAASSLKYPSNFTSQTQRKVELTGEAYFEIAKVARLSPSGRDGRRPERVPFIVESKGQQVEVLGTHFNINAYDDESVVITTLLEGSVKINENTVLKPNQQSVLSAGKLKVQNVDAEDVVAWKNGVFIFDDESLGAIMKRVERWYNVEVVYKNDVDKKEVFGGGVSRFENVSKVLENLEATNTVHFKIEGRKIIIMK